MALLPDLTTVYYGTLQALTTIAQGELCMLVSGDVKSLDDPTPYCLTLSGVDANGNIAIYASMSNVQVGIIDPMANDQPLLVSVTYGATLDITVSQSTDSMGALTGTANEICAAVRAHPLAAQIVQLAPTGTGASVTSAVALTAVPKITILGFAQADYENNTPSPVALDMLFGRDYFNAGTGVATADEVGDYVGIVDSTLTLRKPPLPLDFLAVITGFDADTNVYCRFAR